MSERSPAGEYPAVPPRGDDVHLDPVADAVADTGAGGGGAPGGGGGGLPGDGASDTSASGSGTPGGSGSGGGTSGGTSGMPDGGETPLETHAGEQGAGDEQGAKVRHWREQSRRRRTEKRKRPWWVELPILVVIAFLLTFLIQTFVARVYYVPSGSMEHTLHGTANGGDRILAFKVVYDFRGPEQGEVVVFKGPPTWTPEADIPGPSSWFGKVAQALGSVVGIAPPNEKDFVKRVIAVGGQTISCCDSKGRVQVDGVSLNEPYLFMDTQHFPRWAWVDGQSNCGIDPNDPTHYNDVRCFGPYTVPKGMVWVMGDHRSDSADSSYFCRGLVPAANVHCQGPIPVKDVIGKAVAIVMPPSRWGGIASPDIMSPPPGSK